MVNFPAGGGGSWGNFSRGGKDSGSPSGKNTSFISSGIVAGLFDLLSKKTQSVEALAVISLLPWVRISYALLDRTR
ncbi:MAG TPA: hypothetical protein VMW34_15290, partial [Anaerolineales bacterium]|nr:hypothetical protein [Anaerolineales bacterium]